MTACSTLDIEALPPCDPRVMALCRYWRSIRPVAGRLPGRQHLDPLDLPRLLPWLWLIDVQRAPLRFKFRLVGGRLADALGEDPTHRWIDEVDPEFQTGFGHAHFVAAVERHEIGFYRGPPSQALRKKYMVIEWLVLPLAADGSSVDMLLGLTVLDPRPAARAETIRE